MGIQVIRLSDLISAAPDVEEVKEILSKFKSIPHPFTGEVNDVESFLHQKAMNFEKMTLSTTYLLFGTHKKERVLVGYFSLANKPLTMNKKNYNNLNSRQQRALCQNGTKTESGGYIVNSYLIGQVGKNYSEDAMKLRAINGTQILTLAYDTVLKAKELINARYVWIECEDTPKLRSFYNDFGFEVIENYETNSGLVVMVMKLIAK
ncbi:GNAT family N-acetyltransferase [Carnobacterium maltaromaticum]|uniref:GNAT family N-acetyltransferase n=1 Tax=Carnobacterium maltaromaticum TaxID=2751 RepID=UPI00288DC115|nr:GNAT family N-acetyltransferase [Carnobacterium maltaromaticum]MDT1945971.1 GNAT family N-acetyltransferase [Carnobacterium maltaromaticum]MDT2000475.1 GNAT family N-acetyltransferase [Carnobacterium maltaromaticum]